MFDSFTSEMAGAGALPASLPRDARDLVFMIDALTRHGRVESEAAFSVFANGGEHGDIVTVEVLLEDDDDELHETLLRYAADVRCLDRGGRPLLQVRFFRDGRRDLDDVVVGPFDSWPQGDRPLAVDLSDDAACSPRRFETLLELAADAERRGRTVYFLNVPSYLRLHAEVCAESSLKPINREMVGPRLPDVLSGPRNQQ